MWDDHITRLDGGDAVVGLVDLTQFREESGQPLRYFGQWVDAKVYRVDGCIGRDQWNEIGNVIIVLVLIGTRQCERRRTALR
jgi:hypothetical protein